MNVDLEGDILKGPRDNLVLFSIRPLDRKYWLYIKSIYDIEEKEPDVGARKKILGDLAVEQETMEKDKDAGAFLQAKRLERSGEEMDIQFKGFREAAIGPLLGEDCLRTDSVYAHFAVDELRDIYIDGDAGERIGFVAGEVLFRYEEVDHVADGHLGCGLQVFVEAHGDVSRWGFGARP